MPLAHEHNSPGSSTRAAFLKAHYTVPRDRTQASNIGPAFESATAARASNRGTPGANVLRAVKWAATWRLPSNTRAYQILSLKRVPQHVGALAFEPLGEYALFDKFRRAVLRTWGALVLHEPALQDAVTTSWVALGMHWAFPHNPMLCLEASMHVLANVVPIRPDADVPRAAVDAVVALIEAKRAALTAKWARHRIDPAEIIVPLIKNLGVPVLGESLWPTVFGACVVGDDTALSGPSHALTQQLTMNSAISAAPSIIEPSSSFLLFIAALVLMRASTAEKLNNRQRIIDAHFALFQQDGGLATCKGVATTMYRTVKDLLPLMVMNGPALPRRQMVPLGHTDAITEAMAATAARATPAQQQQQGADQPDYYPPLLNPADEPDRKMIVSVPDFLESIERGELDLAKKGMSKTESILNTAEAMGWTRALALKEQPDLRMMEAELARRDAQRRPLQQQQQQQQNNVSSSMMPGGKINLQHGSSSFMQQQQQQQHPSFAAAPAAAGFDPRYVSPQPDIARAEAERLYQHHRSISDPAAAAAAMPSTTSPPRPPFVVVPSNSAASAVTGSNNMMRGGGGGGGGFSRGSNTATIIKTELPQYTTMGHRSAATRPPSSVAALLNVPNASYSAYPSSAAQMQQDRASGVLLSSPSSSSHPSGVVNSPKRGATPPRSGGAGGVSARGAAVLPVFGGATQQRSASAFAAALVTPQTAPMRQQQQQQRGASSATSGGVAGRTRPHIYVDPASGGARSASAVSARKPAVVGGTSASSRR